MCIRDSSVAEERSEAGAILITIRVASDDIGRVIGKKGSTINAIRHVAKAASIKLSLIHI